MLPLIVVPGKESGLYSLNIHRLLPYMCLNFQKPVTTAANAIVVHRKQQQALPGKQLII